MVSEDDILEYISKLDDVSEKESEPDEKRRVFCRGERIFCVMSVGASPMRLDLRCDSKLSQTLQAQYESVMQSRILGRGGIEILCTGQLEAGEVIDLVRHSYEISVGE